MPVFELDDIVAKYKFAEIHVRGSGHTQHGQGSSGKLLENIVFMYTAEHVLLNE